MYLAKKLTIKLTDDEANYVGHMMYAAAKLWNVANFEKRNWKELNLEKFPSFYTQEKTLKTNLWSKQLPSQTAQQVLKRLQEAWKSFFRLKETGGVENPKPPRFKQGKIQIDYIQNGIKRVDGTTLRLTLPKGLKDFMAEAYDLHADYIFVKNKIFADMERIKRLSFMSLEDSTASVVVVYEIPDVEPKPDNGKMLGIDLGIKNLFTCVSSETGEAFIIGREYFSKARWFDKTIARFQSISASQQVATGIKYPKPSKRVLALYRRKRDILNDYLHKTTRAIVNYCVEQNITTVVIGDITGIRENKDHGVGNQKLHSLPFFKIYGMLEYKLALEGITMVKQEESYTSQIPPSVPEISKKYADKKNRFKRGLYRDGNTLYNADGVGAYNILRKYLKKKKIPCHIPVEGIKTPYLLKVAA